LRLTASSLPLTVAISPYIRQLRERVGHDLLLLPSVAVLVRDEEGRLLLVREAETGLWQTIGGAVEPGESPAQAAVREAGEEAGVVVELTGIRAVVGGPQFRMTYPNGDLVNYVPTIFDARVIDGEPHADGDETIDVAWFTTAQLPDTALSEFTIALLGDPAVAILGNGTVRVTGSLDTNLLPESLPQQIDFILEIDRLKSVLRRSWLLDRSRRENTAEHSWQITLMAIVLAEHADPPVDINRVVVMLLVHDLVEIDAGDTPIYDEQARATQADRERRAADRIFGLLPQAQGQGLRALWEEFEARETPEARFASAIDRLQPLLNSYFTTGYTWKEAGVSREQVIARNQLIGLSSPRLWAYARELIEDAVRQGFLPEANADRR
jgi:5'-deoxynucleotidase YfbR-like HD superfamily hydrolase/8-oxo-dGTP pyrophosphatase MutT (NUDIX family)